MHMMDEMLMFFIDCQEQARAGLRENPCKDLTGYGGRLVPREAGGRSTVGRRDLPSCEDRGGNGGQRKGEKPFSGEELNHSRLPRSFKFAQSPGRRHREGKVLLSGL